MPVKAQVFETSASTNSAIRAIPYYHYHRVYHPVLTKGFVLTGPPSGQYSSIISGTAKIVQNEYSAVMDFLFFVRIPVWAISADLEGGHN